MKGYIKLRRWILDELKHKLSSSLYYHNLEHTLGVLKACNLAIRRRQIPSEEAKLLRIGALAHDIGFTVNMVDHEVVGVRILTTKMAELGFSKSHQEIVADLILATKVPQQPKTDLAQILCDADLDYLGRNDFYRISEKLFLELKGRGILSTIEEWNAIQIDFLSKHRYHTKFALKHREPEKRKRLAELINEQ